MVSVCQSLHRVALQCQQDAESCWYYHQTVVPCLLAMAVQAAMQGRCGAGAGEGESRQLPRLSGVPDPAAGPAAAAALWQPRALRAPLPPARGRAALPQGRCGSGGCACLLPPGSGLQHVPFFPLPAESTHPLLGKALLEEEVLAAMVPVISAATTHLSPE